MRYFLFFLSISFLHSHAQKHEIGMSVGVTNYKGDYTNDNFEIRNFSPGVLFFYKNNITPAFGMRYHLMAGLLRSTDKGSPDPVYVLRNQSLNNLIGEAALQLEYNFLNYRSESNRFKWSPYFLGGLGVYYTTPLSGDGAVQLLPCIPIGIGIKYIFKEHWNFSVEAAARKTFTDALDNADGAVLGGNNDTRDWYLYSGIMVSYTFYDIYCPKPGR